MEIESLRRWSDEREAVSTLEEPRKDLEVRVEEEAID